jgi:hypothetical protein
MIDDRPSMEKTGDAAEERDPVLDRALKEWRAPSAPAALDARVLESYRRVVKPAAWWRRFLASSVRVPLPVALATVILLFVSAGIALRPLGNPRPPAAQPAAAGSIQAARVEQPVVIRTSLAGFEPVSDVNVSVMSERRQ